MRCVARSASSDSRSRGDTAAGPGEDVAVGWRKKRASKKAAKQATAVAAVAAGDPYQTSEVRVIKADSDAQPAGQSSEGIWANDDTGGLHKPGGDVLAELSEAFFDEEPESASRNVELEADAGANAEPEPVADRTTFAIGGGDEYDDIVYLDELVASDDDSGTVFIDDEGRSDALQASVAGASTVDSRLRQRRIGVRRARRRRRLYWAIGTAALFILVVGVLAALGSARFAVKEVTVFGQVYADPQVIDEVIASLEGTPVILVDTSELEGKLEAIPWVETARVTTDFPNAAIIELRERKPVATVQGADGRFRVLDREGRVLDVLDGQPAAVVLLTGPDTVDLVAGQFTEVGHAAAAALVTKLTPDVRARIVAIQTTTDGAEMALVLSAIGEDGPDTVVRLGSAIGDNDQIEKLVRLERVLDDADGAGATVIDVSTAETTQR